MRLWEQTAAAHPDFQSVAVVNPPGIASSALRVAVEILQGGQIDEAHLTGAFGNSIYIDIPFVITADDLADRLVEYQDRPDSYAMDGIISQEEAASYMQ